MLGRERLVPGPWPVRVSLEHTGHESLPPADRRRRGKTAGDPDDATDARRAAGPRQRPGRRARAHPARAQPRRSERPHRARRGRRRAVPRRVHGARRPRSPDDALRAAGRRRPRAPGRAPPGSPGDAGHAAGTSRNRLVSGRAAPGLARDDVVRGLDAPVVDEPAVGESKLLEHPLRGVFSGYVTATTFGNATAPNAWSSSAPAASVAMPCPQEWRASR